MLSAAEPPPPFQLNHVSIEKGPVPKFKFAEFSILTYPLVYPLKLKLFPAFPGTTVTLPEIVPLFPSLTSVAVDPDTVSPSHRLIKPEEGELAFVPCAKTLPAGARSIYELTTSEETRTVSEMYDSFLEIERFIPLEADRDYGAFCFGYVNKIMDYIEHIF